MSGVVEYIDVAEQIEDCGRGHACSFCPQEDSCKLDQTNHSKVHMEQRLGKVNWFVPVMANKGGVGKSTVSANLAVALARQGYAVGLADADIHGPNAPRLFGLQDEKVKVTGRGVHAPEYNVKGRGSLRIGSLAFFLEAQDTPVVWRDAYKHDYIHRMLGSFDWGVLDFLILDMPPGTGNEQITLFDVRRGCYTSALLFSSADTIFTFTPGCFFSAAVTFEVQLTHDIPSTAKVTDSFFPLVSVEAASSLARAKNDTAPEIRITTEALRNVFMGGISVWSSPNQFPPKPVSNAGKSRIGGISAAGPAGCAKKAM